MPRVPSADETEILLTDSYRVATLDNDAALIKDETMQFIQRVAERS